MLSLTHPWPLVTPLSCALRASGCLLPILLGIALTGPAMATSTGQRPTPMPTAPVQDMSSAAVELRQWIQHTGNHAGRPYVVVDKREARVWVFDAQHRPLASSAALLGLTAGDHEVADIRNRDVSTLARQARITPAGRFLTEPGINLQGEDVVWMDYEAGLAMHRVRPGLAQASRLKRLADGVASAQRVSMGCVVLPVAFYDSVIRPLLGQQRGVVYVLPEHSPLQAWLARWGGVQQARAH
jgi:hypothetical protein